jgi:hypothetical protein
LKLLLEQIIEIVISELLFDPEIQPRETAKKRGNEGMKDKRWRNRELKEKIKGEMTADDKANVQRKGD